MSKLSANLQKGLIGHWTMDDRDTDDGLLRDRSGYDNHGSLINSPTSADGFIEGEGLDCDGTGYVETPFTSEDLNEVTMSCWVYGRDWSLTQSVLGSQDPENFYFLFYASSSGIDFYIGGDNGGRPHASLSNNTWHHIVGTIDLTSTGNPANLYVDNKLESSSESTASRIKFHDLPLGELRDDDGTIRGYPLHGILDDVRIYNRVLSEQEIEALYNMRSQRTSNI